MLKDEEKIVEKLLKSQEEAAALAVVAERYKMALEAARACGYTSDVGAIVKVALGG